MKMNKSYIGALAILILLAVLHYFGNHYYLYVRISWYDIIMHILGGAGIALSSYWVMSTYFKGKISRKHLWTIILITFIAGLLWEAMEWHYDIAGAPLGTLRYYVDTIKDLCDDVLGAVIVYLFLK